MKSIFYYLLFFVSVSTFAQQDFQGKAVYQSKTTMDMDFGGREMSEERKKQIASRMKSMLEKTYILTFDKVASTYKEEEKLETPGQGGSGFSMMSSFSGGVKYKNVKEKIVLESTEFFGKKFLITEKSEKPEWKLEGETKQIGSYMCFKATIVKKVDAFDWGNMRRRSRGGERNEKKKDSSQTKTIEKEMPKEILVTAWYTPQVPVSQGPGEYWGLPGLILEVSSGRTTILCSEIVLNSSEKVEIKAPKKGKEVTRDEYNEIVKKKIKEMREMYKGRRGSRGGFRH